MKEFFTLYNWIWFVKVTKVTSYPKISREPTNALKRYIMCLATVIHSNWSRKRQSTLFERLTLYVTSKLASFVRTVSMSTYCCYILISNLSSIWFDFFMFFNNQVRDMESNDQYQLGSEHVDDATYFCWHQEDAKVLFTAADEQINNASLSFFFHFPICLPVWCPACSSTPPKLPDACQRYP